MGEANRKAEKKRELFEKEPENFVHLSELVCAVKVTDGVISHYVGMQYGQHLTYALGKMQVEIINAINILEMQRMQAAEQAERIIKPGDNGKII